MSTDKTPEHQPAEPQADQLDQAQLDEAAGGLLPAVKIYVCPSDPSFADGSVRFLKSTTSY